MKKILLASVISISLTACTSDQMNGGVNAVMTAAQGFTVSEEQIIASARLSANQMDKEQQLASPSSKYTKRLNGLVANLKSYEGINFNYKVYIAKDLNAFAMPDGTVRVYSGLMDKLNDEELLSVIGHEIGHVHYKHSYNQFRKTAMSKAAIQAIGSYGGNAGALAETYGDMAHSFLGAQFSQKDELKADDFGVKMMYKLGKNPYAVASTQEKFMKMGASGGLFSSHPSSQQRRDRAKALADKLTGK